MVVTSLGFFSDAYDSTLFVKSSSIGCILLLLYVNDIIIIGDYIIGIMELKIELACQFDTKDLGF